MLGILEKDEGVALWNGKDLNFDNCRIGYLAEERGLYQKYSLLDQIRYFGRLRGVTGKVLEDRISMLSERLKLDEYLFPEKFAREEAAKNASKEEVSKPKRGRTIQKKVKPKLADQLSKGNQQKIQFLIAMLSDPELLVLDEPFSGLDPVNTDILKEVVREQIEAGKYIIMSSHQMPVVEEFCTDITIMSRSKAIVKGNLNDIKKSYGRVKLALKCETDVTRYINELGIEIISEKEYEYNLKVTGDEQANKLLKRLLDEGITIIRFDLSELSLHEIFVKEVGANENQQG
jgi:ABC-2 type transport system ATP-binding protein